MCPPSPVQTVTMEIIATGITGPQIPARVTGLDNFVFSAQAVPPIPDPRTLALAVVFLDSPNWVSPVGHRGTRRRRNMADKRRLLQ
jgi:hypothetical protein